MLVNLVRFIRGYVHFSAEGKFPERFLNLTSRYGISLWKVAPASGGLTGQMYVGDYKQIRKTARKAKVRLKITQKHGLPFLIAKYKSRLGIPVGAVAGILLILFLSNFIWSISITGTQTISDTRLKEVMSAYGVSIGAYKNNINAKSVQRNTMLEISEIGWMSVNITGNVVSVEVKEKAEKPELNTNTNPCNLKAKCDGVITKTNVRSGVTEVVLGSGVAKGDLLVSGIMQSDSEALLQYVEYVRASGEIYADVNSTKELTLPKEYDYYSITENKSERNRLAFLWTDFPINISISSYQNFARCFQEESLCINNTVLPIGIKKQTDLELNLNKITLDASSAQSAFENEALLYEVFEKGESTLVSRSFEVTNSQNSYNCTINYTFNENIAESVDFSVTE
jgi:similar to stage IV sporulation protein